MKTIFIIALLFIISGTATSQTIIERYRDSVRLAKVDTIKAKHLYLLSYYYQNYKPDSALMLAEESFKLSVKSKFQFFYN